MDRRIRGLLAATLLFLMAMGGCAQRRIYTAQTLPPPLQAQRIESAQRVPMGQLTLPAHDSEYIDGGDLLEISILAGLKADEMTNFSVRVGNDGTILPGIDRFQLVGLHLLEAERQIATACVHRGLYNNPHVTVSIKEQRVNWVTVFGGVEEPGMYKLPRGSSYLWAAIASAKGFAEDAGTKVEIQQPLTPTVLGSREGVQQASNTVPASRSGTPLVCLNLDDPASLARAKSIYLHDGSVVRIEKREPEPVTVLGLVRKPGRIDYPPNRELSLLEAIAEAGGEASKVADKVIITRKSPGKEGMVTIRADLRSAERNAADNLRLAPGDVVRVKQTPATVALDIATTIFSRFSLGMGVAQPW